MEKHLHIVSFDVPWPMDYGGVVDVFCTVKALHAAGIKIHLHCFEYGRGQQPELEQYCAEVLYYNRLTGHKCISPKLPYIVASRSCNRLRSRLLEDNHPILVEGIHCTYLLNDERFANRKIFVRLMNVEYVYYEQLCKSTTVLQPLKKMYYHHESKLLKQYEKSIAGKAMFLALSEQDVAIYRQQLEAKSVACLPPLLPHTEVASEEGIGCFCLYHGNLSVAENEEAAIWLLDNVFDKLQVPFIIAGKMPSVRLQREVKLHGHACLIADPSDQEMHDLIAKAQLNILPSFNSTGIKLKLLNVLFNGRHCVVNEATVKGTGLESACHIGNNAEAFQEIIAQLYHHPFTGEEITLRKKLLERTYNTAGNARRLIQWIWGEQTTHHHPAPETVNY